jgi:hypothetical protein
MNADERGLEKAIAAKRHKGTKGTRAQKAQGHKRHKGTKGTRAQEAQKAQKKSSFVPLVPFCGSYLRQSAFIRG